MREHEHEQPGTQHPDRLDSRLRRGELIGAQDRDHTGVRRQPFKRTRGQPEVGAELRDERAQIESDDTAAGRDAEPGLVLEHIHELLVRNGVGIRPDLLDPRPVEEELHALRGRLSKRRRDRTGERLEVGRELLLEPCADVPLLVELVHDIVERACWTFGSWITCWLARVQAALSSICRFTHVVRIERKAMTDARTTSTQTRIRRRLLSGTTAVRRLRRGSCGRRRRHGSGTSIMCLPLSRLARTRCIVRSG